MRHVVGPLLLLSLLPGCYLFSDEPKVRKQPGTKLDKSTDATVDPDAKPELPKPDGEAIDCPKFLTGTETKARTIAASCGAVRVRGKYEIAGGTLTLEPGAELRFEKNAVLEVGRNRPGTLAILGTPEQPVRLVADMVGDQGGWQGVKLHAQASGSTLKHVEIAGAGTAEQAALWIAAEQLTTEGLTIRGAPKLALEIVAERASPIVGLTLGGAGVVAEVSPSAVASLEFLKLEPTASVAVTAGKIATAIEWPAARYRIEGVIRIEGAAQSPAALTLAPGAKLAFTPEARIIVGGFGPGSLNASADLTEPLPDQAPGLDGSIVLTAAGERWSGIHVQDGGELNLDHVELVNGGSREEGVVIAEGAAKLSLESCEFRGDLVGVELRGQAVTVERLHANGFTDTPVAIKTTPALFGAIGPDNRYDHLARIDVERGKIETDATWSRQAAPILISGDVFVDAGATLTIAPGSRLGFGAGVVLGVGYYAEATLDMRGTEAEPIVLENLAIPGASGHEPTPWGGVVLGAHARATTLEHVRLRFTGNAAGVELRDGADATLVDVDCTQCANATVTWDCASKVGNIGVTAGEGTPIAIVAPTGCL